MGTPDRLGRAPVRRSPMRLIPAAVCAVVIAAAGLGLLVPAGSGSSLPAARVRRDVQILEHEPRGSSRAADALRDLAHMPATSGRPLDLVGMALIAAAGAVSVLLLATWRRSRLFEHHSSRDALTDLANRRQLERDVDKHAHDRVAVLMIDIDHFKILNDTSGNGGRRARPRRRRAARRRGWRATSRRPPHRLPRCGHRATRARNRRRGSGALRREGRWAQPGHAGDAARKRVTR